MNQSLKVILTTLRKSTISKFEILSLFENNIEIIVELKLEEIFEQLKTNPNENVDSDLVKYLIEIIEISLDINEESLIKEIDDLILNNSYSKYEEIVTSLKDIEDETIIKDYVDRTITSTEYFALYPRTPERMIKIGGLNFETIPKNEISFNDKNKNLFKVAYEFTVKISLLPNSTSTLEFLYGRIVHPNYFNLIGMPYLKDFGVVSKYGNYYSFEFTTYDFYKDIIEKYNNYYSNVMFQNGEKLSEIEGIEKCKIDFNRLILVPKLFYLSGFIFDGEISTRPFIYNNKKGADIIKCNKNIYRITINNSNTKISYEEFNGTINLIVSKINSSIFSDSIKVKSKSFKKTDKKDPSKITGYESTLEIINYDSQNSLFLENQLSKVFRHLSQENFINYDFNRSNISSEFYSYNETNDRMNNYNIYYNRSYFFNNGLDNEIIKRNTLKQNNFSEMLTALSENNQMLTYNGRTYTNSPTNYLPISFFIFDVNVKRGTTSEIIHSLTFLPFGFYKYNQTAISEIYNNDMEMTPINVYHVIKLTKSKKESNLIQVIIESEKIPIFTAESDTPLWNIKLNEKFYMYIFKNTHQNFSLVNKQKWNYTHEFIERIKSSSIVTESSNVKGINGKLILNLSNDNKKSFSITRSAFLRFFIECLNIENSFNTIIFNNINNFTENVSISFDNLCDIITDGEILDDFSDDYLEFFKILKDSLNDVLNRQSESFSINKKFLEGLKFFIRSVQNPTNFDDFPLFDNKMYIEITTKFLEEIDATKKEFPTDLLINKTKEEIYQIASTFSGLLSNIINSIADDSTTQLSTHEYINDIKNFKFKELYDILENNKLKSKIGSKININFIKYANTNSNSYLFVKLIKHLFMIINNKSYENKIAKICNFAILYEGDIDLINSKKDIDLDLIKDLMDFDEDSFKNNIVIRQQSLYTYEINCNSLFIDFLLNLNDIYIDNLRINISEYKDAISNFDESSFNSNIHCMFEVEYSSTDLLSNVIKNILDQGFIYYSYIEDINKLTNLNLVSLYESPIEIGDECKIKFFLPFNHNNGRITILKTEWKDGTSKFKLVNPTIEVNLKINNVDDDDFESMLVKIFSSVVIVPNSDSIISSLPSFFIGLNPIKKSYVMKHNNSHYVFTKDFNKMLSSGKYLSGNEILEIVFSNLTQEEIDEIREKIELEIKIIPIVPFVCQFYVRNNFSDMGKSLLRFFNTTRHQGVSKKVCDTFIENFSVIYPSHFKMENVVSHSNSDDETMIIFNPSTIYTKSYGSKFIEKEMISNSSSKIEASSLTKFNDIKIDKIIVNEIFEDENKIKTSQGLKHNLIVAVNKIHWESLTVNNSKFINSNKPTWIKFSQDFYFMGIGFANGVKIYIKSNNNYIFSSNLHHNNVNDIIFGNKDFCITTQIDDESYDYGYLWYTASGIKINEIKINYYVPVSGDAVNIKYNNIIQQEKKNVSLNIDADGKLKYENFNVQIATPIFNHNVYFFSPDDKYLIINSKGTFIVYELENFTKVKFVKFNGSSIDLNKIGLKCIEGGNWIDENIFFGITYKITDKVTKFKITLKISDKSILFLPLTLEYTTENLCSNMLIDNTNEIHPRYSYLLNKRNSFGTNMGFWIYDAYIKYENKILYITNIEGNFMYTNVDEFENLEDLRITLIDSLDFIKIKKIKLNGEVVFNRKSIDTTLINNLPYFYDNFLSFQGDSIYTWSYVNGKTEITHIDSNGYEQFIVKDLVSILIINNDINIGIINGGTIVLKNLNLSENIKFDREKDISRISKVIEEEHVIKFSAHLEKSFEKYTEKSLTKFNVDSKPISSLLCLNRSNNFTLKKFSSTSPDVYQHDNLSIIITGNEIKIIPTNVQIPNGNKDTFSYEWYKEKSEDTPEYWMNNLGNLNSYISKINEIFPQINNNIKKENLVRIKELFVRIRDIKDIKYEELNLSDEEIESIKYILNVFKKSLYLYDYDSLSNLITKYWENNENNEIAKYLEEDEDDERNEEEKYNILIDHLSIIYGDIFSNWEIQNVFKRIREISQNVTYARDGIKSFSGSRKKIASLILNIPLDDERIINLTNTTYFFERVNLVKLEIRRSIKMISNESNYDLFKCLEINNLNVNYNSTINIWLGLNSKTLSSQIEPDFVKILKSNDPQYDEETEEIQIIIKMSEYIRKIIPFLFTFLDENKTTKELKTKKVKSLIVDNIPIFLGLVETEDENLNKVKYSFYEKLESEDIILDEIKEYSEDILLSIQNIDVLNKIPKNITLDEEFRGISDDVEYIMINENNYLIFNLKFDIDPNIKMLILKLFYFLEEIHYFDENEDSVFVSNEFTASDILILFGLPKEQNKMFSDLKIKFFKLIYEEFEEEFGSFNKDLINEAIDNIKEYIIKFSDERIKFSYLTTLNKHLDNIVSFSSLATLKKYLDNIIDVRFPILSDEDSKIILENYNTILDDNLNKFICKWNLNYIKNMMEYYRYCTFSGYYVNNETYNDKYFDLKSKLYPNLKKYRNGCSDDTNVPITIIKLKFQNNIKYVNDKIFIRKENDDILLEYELDPKMVKYGVKYGKIKINLVDIILSLNNELKETQLKTLLMYKTEYNNFGIDFDFKEVEMEKYVSKRNKSNKKRISFDNPTISLTYYKSYKENKLYIKDSISRNNKQFVRENINLICDSKGLPVIFKHKSMLSKFIVYYSNNLENKMGVEKCSGFFVTQSLEDKTTKTIPYILTKIVEDKRKGIMNPFKVEKYKSLINSITFDENTKLIIFDEKIENLDYTYENKISELDITSFLNKFIETEDENKFTPTKFNDASISNIKIKTHGNLTVIVSSYQSGVHNGSLVEIFQTKDDIVKIVFSWNFYLYDIRDFDFNDNEILFIGINNENCIRIGKMFFDKLSSKPTFVRNFDKEIPTSNNLIKNVGKCVCKIGKISYLYYEDLNKEGKFNYTKFLILNGDVVFEKQFENVITLLNVSKEFGYVSLYFKELEISEIWSYSGFLYEKISGECNWI
jgi:hypothetical protein